MWSLETSNCRAAPHLARFAVPALVIQSTGDRGVFPSDARAIFQALAAGDKTLLSLPGAHYFEDAPERRGQVAETIASGIAQRS